MPRALLLLALLAPTVAQADVAPATLCRAAIAAAEARLRIPDAFLSAIGRVESGRTNPDTGSRAPWPWTINAEGEGHFYATKPEAVAAVRQFQARGVRSIDVGCLQVNLMHHPEAFTSLDQAFDPAQNAAFAARWLLTLFQDTGSWPRAAAAYHSKTPGIGAEYQKQVLAEWSVPDGQAADTSASEAARAEPAPARKAASLPPRATYEVNAAPPATTRFLPSLAHAGLFSPGKAPAGPSGRDLASYRGLPVNLAFRPLRQTG